MQVVSNTSPLSALAIIGRLGLLRAQFGTIRIPRAVWTELSRLEHASGKQALEQARSAGRAMARNLKIRITGTLGVLLKAKRDGEIPSLESEMDRLVREAGFFVSDRVRNAFLEAAGELP